MTYSEMSKNQRFAEVIKALRNNGEVYNQTDLSNKMRKSKAYISECMNGKRPITDQFVSELASIFHSVNKSYITRGEGSPLITANNIGNQYTLGNNSSITLGGSSCADNCTSVDQCIELLRTAQNTIDLLIKQRDNAQDIILRTQDQLVRSQEQLTKAQEQVDKLLSLLSNK